MIFKYNLISGSYAKKLSALDLSGWNINMEQIQDILEKSYYIQKPFTEKINRPQLMLTLTLFIGLAIGVYGLLLNFFSPANTSNTPFTINMIQLPISLVAIVRLRCWREKMLLKLKIQHNRIIDSINLELADKRLQFAVQDYPWERFLRFATLKLSRKLEYNV